MQRAVIVKMLVVFVLMAFFYCPAGAQTPIEECEKTITLQNGEIVLDMSGEWDVVYEHYGMFSGLGSYSDVLTITQDGPDFVAVKQIGSPGVPKGSKTIRGECCKGGFKVVEGFRGDVGWVPCKWEISEKGNKILLDDGRVVKITLTRK